VPSSGEAERIWRGVENTPRAEALLLALDVFQSRLDVGLELGFVVHVFLNE
jgi:hypothetical protein